jgi:chromate transporter
VEKAAPSAAGGEPTMRDLALYFLRLGALGFGGPIALAGYMQRDLVEERRWISKDDYVEGSRSRSSLPAPSPRSSRSTSAGCAEAYSERR